MWRRSPNWGGTCTCSGRCSPGHHNRTTTEEFEWCNRVIKRSNHLGRCAEGRYEVSEASGRCQVPSEGPVVLVTCLSATSASNWIFFLTTFVNEWLTDWPHFPTRVPVNSPETTEALPLSCSLSIYLFLHCCRFFFLFCFPSNVTDLETTDSDLIVKFKTGQGHPERFHSRRARGWCAVRF